MPPLHLPAGWIERSLNGTTFTPDPDYNGNAPLTVSFSDYHHSPHILGSPLRNVTKTSQLLVRGMPVPERPPAPHRPRPRPLAYPMGTDQLRHPTPLGRYLQWYVPREAGTYGARDTGVGP